MKRLLFVLASYCWFSSALLTQAAVFERDWKTSGDGLLTYDDVNQREWLDLTLTKLELFSDNPGDDKFSFEDEYQNVIAEVTTGGLFDGFTVAKADDVIALALSAGIDNTTNSFAINSTPTLALIDLLGDTANFQGSGKYAAGFLDEFVTSDAPDCQPCRNGAVFRFIPDVDRAGIRITPSSDFLATTRASVMLYRVIPEPSTMTLLVFGLFLLSRSRRQ